MRQKGEVIVVEDGYDSADLLIVATSESDRKWVLDSRCSFHMTPNKDWFETFKEVNRGQVILGNNKSCEIMGISTVRIKMHDGVKRVLQQVRYIPALKRNLILLGTLDSKGYEYKASGGVLKVTRGCLVVMKGLIENGLYVLQGSTVIRSILVVEDNSTLNSLIWDKRLGHVSERGLIELSKQGLLGGDILGKLQFCENCVFGKATRLKFKRAEHVTTEVLNYVHSDL